MTHKYESRIYILGVLHRGDLHPYEIKRWLNNALVKCYTDLDVGTLYYAVRQLVKSGDIAPKTTQRLRVAAKHDLSNHISGSKAVSGAFA